MFRCFPAVTTVVSISLTSAAAMADEKAPPAEETLEAVEAVEAVEAEDGEPSSRDHAIIVSMGFLAVAGANGLGGVGVGGLMPTFGGGLERRIDDRLWFTARGVGAWNWSSFDQAEQRSWYLDLDLGIRHALTDAEVLEVSWFGSLGGRVMGSAGDHRAEDWAAQLRVGMALDKSFNDWFGIRARIDVFEAGYGRGRYHYDGTSHEDERFYAMLTLSPSFAARFAF